MKKQWIWGAIIVLALLIVLTTAGLALTAGTEEDPLVTFSYLTGTFQQSLLAQAQSRIDDRVDAASQELQSQLDAVERAAQTPSTGGDTGFRRVTLAAGERLPFDAGTELLLLSGSAAVESGSLSDSTAGVTVGSTGGVAVNHLCIGASAGALAIRETAELLIRN